MVVSRDAVIFILGVLIIARQAGIYFEPPAQVSVPLLGAGMIMCNIPSGLHFLTWFFGTRTGSPLSLPESSPQGPRSSQPSVPSSDGEA